VNAGSGQRLKAQLQAKLEQLARDPFAMPGVTPMAEEWRGFYRLRHGDLRVFNLFDQPNDRVVIAHVRPHGDVYE
jgi:mRNA-degrading endonuclease RelE of RelBE toxin-antitoxin system